MVSPFESGGAAAAEAPFDVGKVFGSAASEAKSQVYEGAKQMFDAAHDLNASMRLARKTKNYRWLAKLKELGQQLLAIAYAFFKKAVQLALAKFVLELCAMTINSIMQALTKEGTGRMDITSPNVHYLPNGQPAATSAVPQNPYGAAAPYRSPFDGGLYAAAGGSVSPW